MFYIYLKFRLQKYVVKLECFNFFVLKYSLKDFFVTFAKTKYFMKFGNKIAANLTKLRELKGFTQADLADELGITLSGYGKIERHEVGLTLDRLEKLATILDVSIADILGFDEKFVFNNHGTSNGTQQAETAYNFNMELAARKKELYEQQIVLLKEENKHLKDLIDKLIVHKI
jgi:transcriptional regulator with XRE-family HTH domain